MRKPIIVIFGSAGSGKGTQAALIKEKFGYHIVEAGQIVRAEAKKNTKLGRHVAGVNKEGGHLKDKVITKLMKAYITKTCSKKPLLIDGYPRTLGQAKLLKKILAEAGCDSENIVGLLINVSRREARRRLMNRTRCGKCKKIFKTKNIKACTECGGKIEHRVDTSKKSVTHRLDFFYKKTMKAVKLYKKEGKLVEVDGELSVKQVFGEVQRKLRKYLK